MPRNHPFRTAPLFFLLSAIVLMGGGLTGCATRNVSETAYDSHAVKVKLRSQKPLFGAAEERGFSQPATISPARVATILGGIQVDTRKTDNSAVRERRYAIPRKLLPEIAEAVSKAFAEAGPNQEIVVTALRKQMQKGLFNRKYLTSFVTWIEGPDLYVSMSRVDWKTEQHRQGDKIPAPVVGEIVMPFNTVKNDIYDTVGRQGIKVPWQSEVFGPVAIKEQIASEAEAKQQKKAAEAAEAETKESAGATPEAAGDDQPDVAAPIAASAGAGAAGAATAASESATTAAPAPSASTDALQGLSADDLRKLADLEEARANGKITADEYTAQRQAIMGGGQ